MPFDGEQPTRLRASLVTVNPGFSPGQVEAALQPLSAASIKIPKNTTAPSSPNA